MANGLSSIHGEPWGHRENTFGRKDDDFSSENIVCGGGIQMENSGRQFYVENYI